MSPARDFSVDRKELGLEGVLWLELLLGVVVPGSGALLDESIDVDLTCEEWLEEALRAECGERWVCR